MDDDISDIEAAPMPRGASLASLEVDLRSVVKIFVARSNVSYKLPWQRKPPENVTGSGFLLSQRRILTNVHVVQDSTTILVRRHGSSKKFQARIVCMGWQCDLALLQVEDASFWRDHTPLELGIVPNLQDAVACVGYPTGGGNLSVTCGVVSRVDVHNNSNRHTSLLTVQIDAAINAGNSGGPVFMGNRVVGVAFSHRTAAQNIGYIIPVPVVELFLEDFARHGVSLGFCSDLGFKVQLMENAALRRYHSLPPDMSGVCVLKPAFLSPFYGVLEDGDILLEVDGEEIGDDGTVSYRNHERVKFSYLFTRRHIGDTVSLKYLRDGKVATAESITLKLTPHLVPRLHNFDCVPSYYIVGGVVFMPLTGPLMAQYYGKDWKKDAPSNLLWQYYYGSTKNPDDQVVLLTHVLSSDITIGYKAGSYFSQLCEFNNQPIKNLAKLARLVEDFLQSTRDRARSPVSDVESTKETEQQQILGVCTEASTAETSAALDACTIFAHTEPEESTTGEKLDEIVEGRPSATGIDISENAAPPASPSTGIDISDNAAPSASPSWKPSCKDDFMVFKFGEPRGVPSHLILDPLEVIRESDNILKTHSISKPFCSRIEKALCEKKEENF